MRTHIFISGRVQGVGFRHFTKTNARKLDLKGWVKNLPDGRVEAVFDGEEKHVQEMLNRCKKGPSASYVKKIEEQTVNESETFSEFKVRF